MVEVQTSFYSFVLMTLTFHSSGPFSTYSHLKGSLLSASIDNKEVWDHGR